MPSDARTTAALELIGPAIQAFQGIIAAAADKTDAYLATTVASSANEVAASALGEFAAGRIDIARFTAVSGAGERMSHDDLERALLRRASQILREHLTLPHSRFAVDVPAGGRLTGAIGSEFAELGRAFGAVLVAELVRSGRYDDAEHAGMLHGLPRYRWHRGERAASPPLVVTLDGADLWAGEIAQYLDGNQKIILVVRPPAPPAALVRLITPGMLVMQTSSVETLRAAMLADGPAVAALMPEGAVEFVHLPNPQRPMFERLTITEKPSAPRKALRSWSVWQQEQEVQQLYALAATPPVAALGKENGRAEAADPTDRLAAWLLSQSGVTPVQS